MQPACPDLAARITAEPQRALGAGGQGQSMPVLLKILAAESPLSLQAHPAAAQAAAGFDAEERAGIPWGAPYRNYQDRFAKPEIIVALQHGFQALSGFRPLEEVQGILSRLPLAGPAVAIVESGELWFSGALGSSRPRRGEALYLTPDEHYMRTEGHGEVWVATTSGH